MRLGAPDVQAAPVVDILIGLQAASGNQAVQRALSLQRYRPTPGVILDPASEADNLNQLSFTGFAGVSENDKLILAERIMAVMSRAGRGPAVMYTLWESLGERLIPVAVAHPDLWKRCAEWVPRPRELHNLGPIKKLVAEFRRDTERIADGYLSHNWGVVKAEKKRLFGETGENKPEKRVSDEEAMEKARLAAELVQRLHKKRGALRGEIVGTVTAPGTNAPFHFDPERSPSQPTGSPYASVSARGAHRSWDEVKAEDDLLRATIAEILADHPALFALLRDGKLDSFAADDSETGQARSVSDSLDKLQVDIENAQMALSHGKLNPMDFSPIHDRLTKAEVHGTYPWSDPFYQWVAKDAMSRHARTEFWKNLGLASLSAAAFLLSEFATLGFATVVFAGIGAATTAHQVGSAYNQWAHLDLAEKARTTQDPGLVYQEQVEAARTNFYLEVAFGMFDVATAPGAFAKLTTGFKAGEIAGAAMARGSEAAVGLRQQLARLTKETPGAAETLSQAVDTFGLEEVLRHRNRWDLMKIAGDHSDLKVKLMTSVFREPDEIKEAFHVALDQLSGAATRTLSAVEIDGVIKRAIVLLGPVKVLDTAGGWAQLIARVGPDSASAAHLMHWRDVTLNALLERFARQHLPRGANQEEMFLRTGTQGSPLNDFDVSALGPHSAANRAKMREFMAGYLGVSQDQLKKLTMMDFFADPRRLHLSDYLTPEVAARVERKRAAFEDELVLNRMLHEAQLAKDPVAEAAAKSMMAAKNIKPNYRPPTDYLEDLSGRIDELHRRFASAREVATKADLAERIQVLTSQINAVEKGGFMTGGGAKTIVTDRDLTPALKLPKVATTPAHQLGVVLDQVLKLAPSIKDLRGWLDAGHLHLTIKDMSKAIKRFQEVADQAAGDIPPGLIEPGTQAFAQYELRVHELLPLGLDANRLLTEARGTGAVKLEHRIQDDVRTVLTEAHGLADQFGDVQLPVLQMMRKRVGIEANLGNADGLLEMGQRLLEHEVRIIWAKNALHDALYALSKVGLTLHGAVYAAEVLCGLRRLDPNYGRPAGESAG